MPEVLIITPESLHLLLAQKNYPDFFGSLKIIAVDEWHELLGSKRGVQVELAISRIVNVQRSIFNDSMFNLGNLVLRSVTLNRQERFVGINRPHPSLSKGEGKERHDRHSRNAKEGADRIHLS